MDFSKFIVTDASEGGKEREVDFGFIGVPIGERPGGSEADDEIRRRRSEGFIFFGKERFVSVGFEGSFRCLLDKVFSDAKGSSKTLTRHF